MLAGTDGLFWTTFFLLAYHTCQLIRSCEQMFVTIIFHFDVSCLIEFDLASIGIARGAHTFQLIWSCEQMFVTIIFRFDVSCLIECDLASIGVARCAHTSQLIWSVNPVM